MNPLNDLEFSKLLQTIKEDMPLITDKTFNVKRTFSQGMPKNLSEYTTKINNEFLNNNLAIIEEIKHRDSKHWIPKWFKEYQNKIYGDSEILNKDNFFKAHLHDSFFEIRYDSYGLPKNTRYNLVLGNMNSPVSYSGKVNGAELNTPANNTHGGGFNTLITAQKTTNGVVGQWYDRIAVNCFNSTGNVRVGCYNDSGALPNTLYAESGSNAADSAYTWRTVTEFQLTSVATWASFMCDNASTDIYFTSGLALTEVEWDTGASYGAFPSPFNNDAQNSQGVEQKVGHT